MGGKKPVLQKVESTSHEFSISTNKKHTYTTLRHYREDDFEFFYKTTKFNNSDEAKFYRNDYGQFCHSSKGPTVYFIGDSYTFGQGVVDSNLITSRLCREQNDFKVINLGYPGIGIEEEIELYNNISDINSHHIVVLQMANNDLFDLSLPPNSQKNIDSSRFDKINLKHKIQKMLISKRIKYYFPDSRLINFYEKILKIIIRLTALNLQDFNLKAEMYVSKLTDFISQVKKKNGILVFYNVDKFENEGLKIQRQALELFKQNKLIFINPYLILDNYQLDDYRSPEGHCSVHKITSAFQTQS